MAQTRDLIVTYLLNSLWQVPLLFLAGLLASRLLRRHGSVTTYRLWAGTLALQVLLPALATAAPWIRHLLASLSLYAPRTDAANITVLLGPVKPLSTLQVPSDIVTCMAVAYGGALLWGTAKFARGCARTAGLSARARAVLLTPEQQLSWEAQRTRFLVPCARLIEAAPVHVPMTIGVRRPCILLPPGFLGRASSADLDTLFAHECAHIQRRDFLWNFVLQVLVLPVAYHPALRWTRARMTESREWVCDELAMPAVGTPLDYARSLLRLATQLVPDVLAIPNHAIGIFDANALERRVMRLTQLRSTGSVFQRAARVTVCVLVGSAACGSAWAWRTKVMTPVAQQATDGRTPVTIASGVMAGNVATRVNPVYPPEAKQKGLQGSVVLQAIISAEGTVEQLTVVSGPEELSRAAIDAVRQWTYKPFEMNGEPVPVTTTITVNFRLEP